jgi:hypothetical protein
VKKIFLDKKEGSELINISNVPADVYDNKIIATKEGFGDECLLIQVKSDELHTNYYQWILLNSCCVFTKKFVFEDAIRYLISLDWNVFIIEGYDLLSALNDLYGN